MFKPRFLVLLGMILLAAASRLIPHPPNFAPITATALFGGAYFSDKRLAFVVPLTAMFLSDVVIGLHTLMPVIYGSFALIVCVVVASETAAMVANSWCGIGKFFSIFYSHQLRCLGHRVFLPKNDCRTYGLLYRRHSIFSEYIIRRHCLHNHFVWQLCSGRKTISGFRPIFLEDN